MSRLRVKANQQSVRRFLREIDRIFGPGNNDPESASYWLSAPGEVVTVCQPGTSAETLDAFTKILAQTERRTP